MSFLTTAIASFLEKTGVITNFFMVKKLWGKFALLIGSKSKDRLSVWQIQNNDNNKNLRT